MKNSNAQPQRPSETKNSYVGMSILSALLFFALIGLGFLFFENSQLNDQVNSLDDTRTELISEIDELKVNYDQMLTDNSDLKANYTAIIMEMEEKSAEFEKIRKANSDKFSVVDEVKRLRSIKIEYAEVLGALREQAVILSDANTRLMSRNADLENRVKSMNDENQELNRKVFELNRMTQTLARETVKYNAPIAKATNINVMTYKNNNRPTGSAKRTKAITVDYRLENITDSPNKFQNIYLVIKDMNGIPVGVENPINVTIKPTEDIEGEQIIAQQSMQVNLDDVDDLKFSINPKSNTLHEGYYRAFVYSHKGLLGSSQFYLR